MIRDALAHLVIGLLVVGGIVAALALIFGIEYGAAWAAINYPSAFIPLFLIGVCFFVGWLVCECNPGLKRRIKQRLP